MRLTSKGQVTIPRAIRELAGLRPGCEVEFEFKNGQVVLEKVETDTAVQRQRVQAAIEAVAGSASVRPVLRTDEVLAMTRGEDRG